ncbi:MAG: DUF4382 domain-containing protein [Candidatus Aenigmatarchaeota archaeon]
MAWKNYWRHYSGPDYKFYAFAIILLIIGVFVAYSGFGQHIQPPTTTTTTTTTTSTTTSTPAITTGTLIIGVKDSHYKLPGGNDIMGLNITVTKVEVHEATDNETDETGWITIYEGNKTVDLLRYDQVIALIAQKDLDAGKYTQIRLFINDSTTMVTNIYQRFYNKTYPVIIKNEDKPFKIVHPFTLESNQTLTLTFDFDIEKCITKDSEGYKLKPVLGKVGPSSDGVLEEKGKPSNSETV